jgi:hypothetical protein
VNTRKQMALRFKRLLFIRLLRGLIVLCVCVYLIPFIYLIASDADERSKVGEGLVFHLIIEDPLKPSLTPNETLLTLMRWVNRHIRNPNPSEKANDVSRLHILESGVGYCDQQVNVYLALCEAAGLSGRMVWLYGEDSVSAHTVAEVYYNNTYHMVDPYYRNIFHLPDREIASVDDIVQGNILPAEFEKISVRQQRLYGKRYPWKIAQRSPVSKPQSFGAKLVFLYADLLGPVFYVPWLRICNHYSGIPVFL